MTVTTMWPAQNWCADPYGRHDARWFSRGYPTALVRDGGAEYQDPPPDGSFAERFGVCLGAGSDERPTVLPPT